MNDCQTKGFPFTTACVVMIITEVRRGGDGIGENRSETSIGLHFLYNNINCVSLQVNNPKENEKSSAVFVSVLLTGLLLAAIIIGGFCYKSHRKTNNKGMKLAEESYMADEENQGNTLMSVAPLNQPEPEEKPSLNGESPEGVKTPTPPAATNGHSTTKTADTEL
nr:uncharacterized protein cd34 [Misgurnus anguillicaudatus]